MACKICGQPCDSFGTALVLGRHTVHYFRCANCGFMQTEAPFWLDEAYNSAITSTDIGSVNRALTFGTLAQRIILSFFDPGATFLDYGGGYGIFTRLMRDRGLDFRHYDRFCDNLFAAGCAADLDDGTRYELITAFEVFEHLEQPLVEVERMLSLGTSILFSTQLLPSGPPPLGQWWYYSPEHGQHIAFYTRSSLEQIARRYRLRLYTNGSSLHLLTGKKLNQRWFDLLFRHRVTKAIDLMLRRRMRTMSLLASDYERLSGQKLP